MQQTFEAGVDASAYMLRAAETPVGQAYKTLALQHLALAAGDIVVDLGCGPGADLRRYAEAVGPGGQVVGVDYDDTAVTDARARTADLSQVQVWLADISALDLVSGSVDAVHADRVLQHVADPSAAVAEAVRILRPGGRVVFAEPDWRTLVVDHPEPQLSEAFTRYVVDYQVRNPWIGIALPRLCRSAGLTELTVIPVTTVFETLAAADRILGFDRVSQRAVDRGLLSAADRRRWLDELASNWTSASVTLFMVAALVGSPKAPW